MTTGSIIFFSLIVGGFIAIALIGLFTKKIIEKKQEKERNDLN